MASIVVAGDTSGTVTLAAPSVAGTTTLTLPTANGTVLTTGSTTGVNASAISTGTLAAARLPAGSVLQVVQGVMTGAQSTTSTSYIDVSGLTVTITPSSTSSKVLVLLSVNGLATTTQDIAFLNLLRNGSVLTFSAAGGLSTTYQAIAGFGGIDSNLRIYQSVSFSYLDSPASSSALVYKCQFRRNASGTAYVNQWPLNNDVGTVSTITVMEIAQ